MPELDREQRSIVAEIVRASYKIKDPVKRRKFKRAAVQTGLVESNLRNLAGGDADSEGWRQERASLYDDPRNVRASVERFRQEFLQHYDPGERASDVAGQVQRPAAQYLGRYQERAGDAKRVLGEYGGASPGAIRGADDVLEITPGEDRSYQRKALQQQYLLNRRDPDALLNLATGLRGAQDGTSSARVVPGDGAVRRNGRPVDVNELFYDPLGYYLDEGQRRPGSIGGHGDHLHVATNNPQDADRIGRWATLMGLHVSENATFDKVDPVHTKGSFHYDDKADDISGDPAKIRRLVRKINRRRKR